VGAVVGKNILVCGYSVDLSHFWFHFFVDSFIDNVLNVWFGVWILKIGGCEFRGKSGRDVVITMPFLGKISAILLPGWLLCAFFQLSV
jgi:hypothetical protein